MTRCTCCRRATKHRTPWYGEHLVFDVLAVLFPSLALVAVVAL
jgi:hypothetical protein